MSAQSDPANSPPAPPPGEPGDTSPPASAPRSWRFYALIAGCILLGCMLLTALFTSWWIRHTFHAKPYQPTELSQTEEVALEGKLQALEASAPAPQSVRPRLSGELPGRSSREIDAEVARLAKAAGEAPASARPWIDPLGDDEGTDEERRHLVITERELNGILHSNTDLADRVRIELREDTIRAGALIPFSDDALLFAGKTLRCKLTIRAYLDENKRLAVFITDVTVGGIPVPNAWVGDIKNCNLVASPDPADPRQRAPGGMNRFADGIRDFKISDKRIEIWLNE